MFTASLFHILKYFKLDHLIIKNVFTQILFHLIEAVLYLYAFYLMNDGEGYIFPWLFMYILMFLPLSIYLVRYGDDDKKYKS